MLEEARRLSDEANLREQRMLEESHANLELMKELLREHESAALAREQLNYEREEKQQTLASRREETPPGHATAGRHRGPRSCFAGTAER